jgi:hypothetical protein
VSSTRTVTLVGADGTRHVLACSDEPMQLGIAAQLHGTAPYSTTSRRVGLIPGERPEVVQALPRTLVVPVLVQGGSELAVDQELAKLGAILRPTDDLTLIYKRPDGTERQLLVRYTGGGDALAGFAEAGWRQRSVTVPLVFRAYWPYWLSPSAPTQVHGPEEFDDGWAAGSNLVTITNAGDVDVWPEFIVTGYTEGIEFMSLTLGRTIRVTRIIQIGDELRIVTDPRNFGTYINGVGDYVLDARSEPWPLEPDANVILAVGATATGAEPIGSFQIRWRPQFETP